MLSIYIEWKGKNLFLGYSTVSKTVRKWDTTRKAFNMEFGRGANSPAHWVACPVPGPVVGGLGPGHPPVNFAVSNHPKNGHFRAENDPKLSNGYSIHKRDHFCMESAQSPPKSGIGLGCLTDRISSLASRSTTNSSSCNATIFDIWTNEHWLFICFTGWERRTIWTATVVARATLACWTTLAMTMGAQDMETNKIVKRCFKSIVRLLDSDRCLLLLLLLLLFSLLLLLLFLFLYL